jgi:hypothetical protein
MIRSRWILVLALLAVCAALSFGAEAKPATPSKTAPKEEPAGSFLGGRDLGLIVNAGAPFVSLSGAGDGVQTGLGMKLWLNDRSVVRALLDVGYTTATDVFEFGLSAAYEHHLARGKVSPYLGGLVGVGIDIGAASNLQLYGGGLFGAEVKVIESVAFFVEYALLFEMDEPDFTIDLGLGNGAQLGIIIYLQ